MSETHDKQLPLTMRLVPVCTLLSNTRLGPQGTVGFHEPAKYNRYLSPALEYQLPLAQKRKHSAYQIRDLVSSDVRENDGGNEGDKLNLCNFPVVGASTRVYPSSY